MDIPNIRSVEPVERGAQTAKREPKAASSSQEEQAQSAAQAEKSNAEANLEAAAKELTESLGLKVELTQDENTGRGVVRIFSQDGERLLRQMPPEQVLRLAARARQGALEGIVDSKV